MPNVSDFNLLTGSSSPLLAAGDVVRFVDVSDTVQSPQGSLVRATLTQFFAAIPVPIITTGRFSSVTALATPGALIATTLNAFASTVSGAAVMGFGTTNDVSLMNRAGTVVLGIGPNTTAVNMAGALAITGALSGVTTLAGSGAASGFTSYASSRAFNNYQTIYASTGTVVTGGWFVGSNTIDGIHMIVTSNHGFGIAVNNGAPSFYIANTGAATFTGAVSGITTLAIGGDVTTTATVTIKANTSDGSDNRILTIASGGADVSTRGAYIVLAGNEAAGAGSASITAGGGGSIALNAGTTTVTILTSGITNVSSGLTVAAGAFIVTAPTTPASAGATGTIGTIAWDTGFLYVCTATNTWERVAIATW